MACIIMRACVLHKPSQLQQAGPYLHAVGGTKHIHPFLASRTCELYEQLSQQPAGACICVGSS